jgi:hypothetical protein
LQGKYTAQRNLIFALNIKKQDMDNPFDEFLANVDNKDNPECWIYCHPDWLNHFIESEKLIKQSVEKVIFRFLYQGARIGVRPLRDVERYYLFIHKKGRPACGENSHQRIACSR